jgi:hypothetical protein
VIVAVDLERVAPPGSATVLLLDDRVESAVDTQRGCLVPVAPFAVPYDQPDTELEQVMQRVLERLEGGA